MLVVDPRAVEVVAGAVVVLGTEMDVGPSDAGKPTLPAVLRRCFGSFTVDCGS